MTTITETQTGAADFLGNYRILRLLGRGGMGDVYLAWSGLRLVAIKILHPHHAADATFVAMFLAEARVAGRINHSGIAQVLDVGVDAGRLYMVMEYVAGHTLDELIRDPNVKGDSLFPLRIGVSLFAFVAHALDTAHRAQIIHRDISPHNLLVSDTGAIKIIDFGIARTQSSDSMTTPGTFRGRFGYMAPEYVQGHECDHRVDLFALGVVMWETFARRRLYPGAAAAQLYSLIERPAERLDAAIPGFPAALADVVERLLQRDPKDRYARASEVAHALEDLLPTLPDDGFRNLAHWVSHHLSRKIAERARTDHDDVQRIATEERAAVEADEPLLEFQPTTNEGAAQVILPRRDDHGSKSRWPLLIGLAAFGLAMALGAIWLVREGRAPQPGKLASSGVSVQPLPLESARTPPVPAPPPPMPSAATAPEVTAVEPVPAEPATGGTATEPAATDEAESTRRHRTKREEKAEAARAQKLAAAAARAERANDSIKPDPAAPPPPVSEPSPPPPPAAPERPPVAVSIPSVTPPPPPPPTAAPKTPRVPDGQFGDEKRGGAVLGQCNACHVQKKARRTEGKQMTRSQWERFFRNGTHDRYLSLGGQMSLQDLAAAKAFLSARALDASEDQGAGVR
jgi:eukaryotic-like serine/threonine-protein kinase